MERIGRIGQRVALFSLLVLVGVMVLFPKRFGTNLLNVSVINLLYELVFYGVVLYAFNRRVSLFRLIQGSGLCVVYRLALSAVFGLLVAMVYKMDMEVALQLTMSTYLPGLLLQIIATPFIMRPVVMQMLGEPARRPQVVIQPYAPETSEPPRTHPKEPARAASESFRPQPHAEPEMRQWSKTTEPANHPESGGFDRAARYIGEQQSVQMAAVIDAEGLLLGSFKRGDTVPEDVAPLALLLFEQNQPILSRGKLANAERIDVTLRDERVVVARGQNFYLMVVSDRQTEDLVHIRITQAMDMIRKYMSERYGQKAQANAEKSYVSSAQ